jgi:hypothetical protein
MSHLGTSKCHATILWSSLEACAVSEQAIVHTRTEVQAIYTYTALQSNFDTAVPLIRVPLTVRVKNTRVSFVTTVVHSIRDKCIEAMIGAAETDVIFCDAALCTNTAVENTYLGRLSSLR